ncbi:MAG: hypothetical protein AB4038_05710 [Prochloraceae cyanobacterium]
MVNFIIGNRGIPQTNSEQCYRQQPLELERFKPRGFWRSISPYMLNDEITNVDNWQEKVNSKELSSIGVEIGFKITSLARVWENQTTR